MTDVPEPVIDADLQICDAHHHLWHLPANLPEPFSSLPRKRYLIEELMIDVGAGHRVGSTVFVEGHAFYRAGAAVERQSIGETEFAAGQAAMAASGRYGPTRACAGIVSAVDLRCTDVTAVLESHIAAANGRLRGIRQAAALDPLGAVLRFPSDMQPGLYLQPQFRAGFARLAQFGLSFDAWIFHPQISDVEDLARAFPKQLIVLDHLGAPLRIGPYATRLAAVFEEWRGSIERLAACPNVVMKLGGLGMGMCGFGFDQRKTAASSEELADTWRPFMAAAIAAFGPDRCMFESNFPVDAGSCSYVVLWNAFKRIAAEYGPQAREGLLRTNAERVYRLGEQGTDVSR
jgi:predicted TIM-barrel fold metal-dependent hydrolase